MNLSYDLARPFVDYSFVVLTGEPVDDALHVVHAAFSFEKGVAGLILVHPGTSTRWPRLPSAADPQVELLPDRVPNVRFEATLWAWTGWAGGPVVGQEQFAGVAEDGHVRCLFAVRPNESRLSCGALKKDSFHNLRAPPASSAC